MLDTGLARPPSPTYTAITPVTRAPEKNAPAAETDLPPEETVTPSSETQYGRQAADHRPQQQGRQTGKYEAAEVERRNVIDPESESLVYIATNIDTGEVVRQIPSETLLRLRAYTDTLEARKTQGAPGSLQETA